MRAELPDTDERVRSGRPFRTSLSRFNANRLSAHRTAERGIRFIRLPHCVWDHHNEIRTLLPKSCGNVDQGSAALLKDLKQRGLVQGTSIAWCGGVRQNSNVTGDGPGFMGRDHHGNGCLMRMAGGIKGGFSCGAADDLGNNPAEDATDVRDLHAAILLPTGIDHAMLTYRFHGCDFRLPDVHGKVVSENPA